MVETNPDGYRRKNKLRYIQSAIITGPTGAIGTALCRKLASEGVQVYAFVRPDSKRSGHLKEIDGVELIECDASQLVHLPQSTQDLSADAFFHLAWSQTTGAGRNDMKSQIQNIQYTMDAVHAAMVFGCDVFIGAGSQAEYGRIEKIYSVNCGNTQIKDMAKDNDRKEIREPDFILRPDMPCFPENGYGMAKLCAGQMSRAECEKLRLDHIWPRILSVYGPYDGENAMIPQVIRKLLNREKPSLTAGGQIWDYMYADDAAEALYKLAVYGKSGKIYPLGSGEARPLREYIEILRDEIDPSLPLGFGEIPYGEKQVMHLKADISELCADTGFTPQTDFKTGIQKTINKIFI